jgi:hypothetical protein
MTLYPESFVKDKLYIKFSNAKKAEWNFKDREVAKIVLSLYLPVFIKKYWFRLWTQRLFFVNIGAKPIYRANKTTFPHQMSLYLNSAFKVQNYKPTDL